jgi:hypothetical protein
MGDLHSATAGNVHTAAAAGHKVLTRLDLTDDQRKALSTATGREVRGVDLVELNISESQKLNPALARPAAILMCW